VEGTFVGYFLKEVASTRAGFTGAVYIWLLGGGARIGVSGAKKAGGNIFYSQSRVLGAL
jgi:predicted helicase